MQKQLAAPDRLLVWFSAQRLKALLSVGLRRFLFATLLGSFALAGLFFSMQALGQGWQAAQSFEGIAFASLNGDRSRLNSPGGCGPLDGGTVSGSGPGGGRSADLEVTKFVDKPNPREGDTIVYTVFLANLGPDNATSVRVRDVLPGGVTYAGAIPSRGDYDPVSGLWSIDNLSKCGSATLTLSATVNPGTAGETITNTASYVSAEPPDSKPGNNVGEAVIKVQPPAGADLAITKTVNITHPNAGDTITYTVIVINNGPDDASGVRINDKLPPGVAYVPPYTASPGNYDNVSGFWTVGNLSNSTSATLTIMTKVNDDMAGQTILNAASVLNADQNDPISSNNTSSVAINVISGPPRLIYLPTIYKDYEPPICSPYFDNFSNTRSGWITDTEGDVLTNYYMPTQKYFIDRNIAGVRLVQAPVTYANNYTVEVDINWNINKIGFEYGLLFGQIGDVETSTYLFMVNPENGTYRVMTGSVSTNDWDCVSPQNNSACIHNFPPGLIYSGSSVNNLAISCNKDTFSLYVNGSPNPLSPGLFNGSCRGMVGIFAQSLNGSPKAQAFFDNFKVSCPPSLMSTNSLFSQYEYINRQSSSDFVDAPVIE